MRFFAPRARRLPIAILSPMVHQGLLASLLAALALLAAAPASAQQTEFRLNDKGEWVAAESPKPGTDAYTIAEARRALANGHPGEAKRILDPWLTAHDHGDSPYLPEAFLLRGDARTASGDEYEALYDYEAISLQFPGSAEFVKAQERELEIAIRYCHGYKRKFLGLRVTNANSVGEELLVRVQERLPGSRLAEKACIELADFYYRERELKLAAEAYEIFIKNYPSSPWRSKAMQRQIEANIARFKGPRFDASPLVEARTLIQEFSERDPVAARRTGLSDAMVARLDESIAAQMFESGRWYFRRGDDSSAAYTLRRMIARYPATVAAERARELAAAQHWDISVPLSQAAHAPPAAEPAPATNPPPAPEPAKEPAR